MNPQSSLKAFALSLAIALIAATSPARGAETLSPADVAAMKEIAAKNRVVKVAAEKAEKLTKIAESKSRAKKPDAGLAAAEAEQARNEAAAVKQEADDVLARFNNEREARWIASLGTDAVAIFNLTSPRPVPPGQVELIIGGKLGPATGRPGAGVAK